MLQASIALLVHSVISSFHSLNRNPHWVLSLEVFGPDVAVDLADQRSLTLAVLRLGDLDHLEGPRRQINRGEVGFLGPGEGVVDLRLALCLGDAEGILVEVELFGDGDVDGIDVVVGEERGVALLDLEAGLAGVLLCGREGQQQSQD